MSKNKSKLRYNCVPSLYGVLSNTAKNGLPECLTDEK